MVQWLQYRCITHHQPTLFSDYTCSKITCGLFNGMVHDNAHWLVHTAHYSGEVATVEFVCPHHFTSITLWPVDIVFKDGHTMRVLKNLKGLTKVFAYLNFRCLKNALQEKETFVTKKNYSTSTYHVACHNLMAITAIIATIVNIF